MRKGPFAGRRRGGVPRQRVAYLFADGPTFHDVVESQRKRVVPEVDAVDPAELLRRPFDEIEAELVHRLRIDMPVLDREHTVSLPNEEIDIDVSGDPRRAFFPHSGPHFVKGTLVRIAIPFSGEAVLFKYGTVSPPYNIPVSGEVDGHHIILSCQAEHPDAATIKQDFDQRASQIEEKLRMGRGRTDEWNREVVNLVRARLTARKEKLEQAKSFSLGFPAAPPRPSVPALGRSRVRDKQTEKAYDLFLSHASEDKASIARPLYEALTAADVSVWFDEAVLKLGDGLRMKIDEGLARCRYGIVVLSPTFFSKHWPQLELDGLVARETASGKKAIIPIWHEIDQKGVAQYSPTLADRLAGKSSDGLDVLVRQIVEVLKE
jgi:TIR domain-containing protein